MKSEVYYLTHPQVAIDPNVPVPRWGLSDLGRGRILSLLTSGWVSQLDRIISSAETKAIETAEIIGRHIGKTIEIKEHMHENDRSATGFLPPEEFEEVSDAFFGEPSRSVRGWEPAQAAQARIVAEVTKALADGKDESVLFVGHGAVGTLLMLHLAGEPISRTWDQPHGGGNFFKFDRLSQKLIHRWQSI